MKIRHVLWVGFGIVWCCYSILCLNVETLASSHRAFAGLATRSQDQTPNRQTLPPEKKKSLARLGPDELFPGEREPGPSKRQDTPSSNRKRSTSKLSTPKITAPSTASRSIPTAAPPESTPPAAQPMVNQLPAADPVRLTLESQSSPQSSFDWQMPVLSLLTAAVFIGLLYVLSKLRELLRDGSS
jgi:hypothetical protein